MNKPDIQPAAKTFAIVIAGVCPENFAPEHAPDLVQFCMENVSTTAALQQASRTIAVGLYTDDDPRLLAARLTASPIVTGL